MVWIGAKTTLLASSDRRIDRVLREPAIGGEICSGRYIWTSTKKLSAIERRSPGADF
jgi:hypothetical protein